MKNKKVKLNQGTKGTNCVCLHMEEDTKNTPKTSLNLTSHLSLLTSNKGITLIALIITIIVMLILVGVTINVALQGGLFTTAKEAVKQTQITQVKEMVISDILTKQTQKRRRRYNKRRVKRDIREIF